MKSKKIGISRDILLIINYIIELHLNIFNGFIKISSEY